MHEAPNPKLCYEMRDNLSAVRISRFQGITRQAINFIALYCTPRILQIAARTSLNRTRLNLWMLSPSFSKHLAFAT